MYWKAVYLLVAVTFSQVLARVVDPEIFNEDVINEVDTPNNRISMGWEAYPGQFPYVAALSIVSSAGDVSRCGSSVVHRNWVLTSARCVANSIFVVVSAGVTDLTAAPEYISDDTEWRTHPSYNTSSATAWDPNNIAILKLQQPLTYSKLVQPIRILPLNMAFINYTDVVLVTCGWGRLQQVGAYSDVLRWVYLRGITNSRCRSIFSTSVSDTHICAGTFNATSQSICEGDHGGPLVYIGLNEEPLLVGVASFWSTGGCSAAGRPSGFIRPGAYHNWLTEVTGLDFQNLDEGVTETTESPTTEATQPETTETPTTEATQPETTETPTTEATQPETTETSTTEATQPPSTEATEPPTTEATEPPTTETTESDSEESEQNDSNSSESKEDLEKRLKKKVIKISKVKINNNIIIN